MSNITLKRQFLSLYIYTIYFPDNKVLEPVYLLSVMVSQMFALNTRPADNESGDFDK